MNSASQSPISRSWLHHARHEGLCPYYFVLSEWDRHQCAQLPSYRFKETTADQATPSESFGKNIKTGLIETAFPSCPSSCACRTHAPGSFFMNNLSYVDGAQLMAIVAIAGPDTMLEEELLISKTSEVVVASKLLLSDNTSSSLVAYRRLVQFIIEPRTTYYKLRKQLMRQSFAREYSSVSQAVRRLHPVGTIDWAIEIPWYRSHALKKGHEAIRSIMNGTPPQGVGEALIIITLAMSIRHVETSLQEALPEDDLYRDMSRWQMSFRDKPVVMQAYKTAVKETWGLELDEIPSANECDAGCLHLFQDMVLLLISGRQKRITNNVSDAFEVMPIDLRATGQDGVSRPRGIVDDNPQLILASWLMMGTIMACVIAGMLFARTVLPDLPMSEHMSTEVCGKRNLVWAARHLSWIKRSKIRGDSGASLGSIELSIGDHSIVDFRGLVQWLSCHSDASLREETIVHLSKWRASYTAQFCYSLFEAYLGYKTAHSIVAHRQEPMKLSEYDAHLDSLRPRKPITSNSLDDQNTLLAASMDGSAASSRPPSRQPKQCNICKKWFKGGTPALGKHKRSQQCQKPKEKRERRICGTVPGCEKNYLSRFELEEHQRKDHGLRIPKRKYQKAEVGEKEEGPNKRIETGVVELNCF